MNGNAEDLKYHIKQLVDLLCVMNGPNQKEGIETKLDGQTL